MKKYIVQAVLGFFVSLISTLVFPLYGQTIDTLKNSPQVSQLRAELAQIQALSASIKAKADSLEALVKNKAGVLEGSDQEYWSAMLQPNKNCCGDKSAELRADIIQDKLIKKESALRSYHLDLEIFRINGQIQTQEITKKYQEKYLTRKPNGDHTTSMTHTVGGFLGIRL